MGFRKVRLSFLEESSSGHVTEKMGYARSRVSPWYRQAWSPCVGAPRDDGWKAQAFFFVFHLTFYNHARCQALAAASGVALAPSSIRFARAMCCAWFRAVVKSGQCHFGRPATENRSHSRPRHLGTCPLYCPETTLHLNTRKCSTQDWRRCRLLQFQNVCSLCTALASRSERRLSIIGFDLCPACHQ